MLPRRVKGTYIHMYVYQSYNILLSYKIFYEKMEKGNITNEFNYIGSPKSYFQTVIVDYCHRVEVTSVEIL